MKTIILTLLIGLSYSQPIPTYDYSLEDINPTSMYFGENIGPSDFSNNVTIHYFGHFN